MKPNFYAACYAIIKNEKGEILFQKRSNTGFRDGEYQLPAGHMDGNETMKECMVRELKEELSIITEEQDLDMKNICHRKSTNREYFDVYFEINNYKGKVKINEVEKCSELKFIDIENIEEPELFSYDVDIINEIGKGIYFSEKMFK